MKIKISHTINQRVSESQIIELLLKSRNIKDLDEFINPPHPTHYSLEDFFENKKKYRKDFEKVTKILEKIHQKKEMVIVYTDYDADGITGGAILWETLYKLGFNVMPYVPHRKREGYGFSKKGIDAIKKKYNPALIISVDHGISAGEKISYAKKIGIPIVVTDHHMMGTPPKDALAYFHTTKLSGAGVSYFFAKEITKGFRLQAPGSRKIEDNFENDYAGLAAIGIIADLVPLVGSARSLVKHGLACLQTTKRAGILHLIKNSGLTDKKISTYEIGFMIAPRINAFGRLEHALDALRLLCTTAPERAADLARRAGAINTVRQNLVEEAVAKAEQMVNPEDKIITLFDPDWEEGILGLIASRICEKHYRPTLAMSGTGDLVKGSARSIYGFDITSFLSDLKKYLTEVGGHTGAAGFSLESKNIEELRKQVTKRGSNALDDKDLIPVINVDISTDIANLTLPLARELDRLEPFGVGNSRPLFHTRAQVIAASVMGKNRNHLKLYLSSQTGQSAEFVFFGQGQMISELSKGTQVDAVFSLSANHWNGTTRVQGILKHLRQSE